MAEQSQNSQKQQQLASSGIAISSAQPLEIRHFDPRARSSRERRHGSDCKRNRFSRLSRLSRSAPTEVDTVDTASQTGDPETSSDKQENQLMRRFNRLTKTRLKSLGHILGLTEPDPDRASSIQDDARTEISDDTVETNSLGKESTDFSSSYECMNDSEIRTFTVEQAGLNLPKLKNRLKITEVQRAHLKDRIWDLEKGFSTHTDSKDALSISGGNTSCKTRDDQFQDLTIEVAVFTESPPADKTLSDENEDCQETLTAKPGQAECDGQTESAYQLPKLSDEQTRTAGEQLRRSRDQSLSLTEAATGGSSSREIPEQSKGSQTNSDKKCGNGTEEKITDETGKYRIETREVSGRRYPDDTESPTRGLKTLSKRRSRRKSNEFSENGEESRRRSGEEIRKNSAIDPKAARRMSKDSTLSRSSKKSNSEKDEFDEKVHRKASRKSQNLVKRFSRLSETFLDGEKSMASSRQPPHQNTDENEERRASIASSRSSKKSQDITIELKAKRSSAEKSFENSVIQPKNDTVNKQPSEKSSRE